MPKVLHTAKGYRHAEHALAILETKGTVFPIKDKRRLVNNFFFSRKDISLLETVTEGSPARLTLPPLQAQTKNNIYQAMIYPQDLISLIG